MIPVETRQEFAHVFANPQLVEDLPDHPITIIGEMNGDDIPVVALRSEALLRRPKDFRGIVDIYRQIKGEDVSSLRINFEEPAELTFLRNLTDQVARLFTVGEDTRAVNLLKSYQTPVMEGSNG